MSNTQAPEDEERARKAAAVALIPQFQLERVLNQDQNGRRISLLGQIASQPAVMTLERAAFPSEPDVVSGLLSSLMNVTNLQHNDIYRWYMSNLAITPNTPPSLKLNLIYPSTPQHVTKYSAQRVRLVTESPAIYASHIRPYISRQRTAGRLDWIYNILEGRTEQEDVILREPASFPSAESEAEKTGFLLLPDLNWDRKTLTGLHLLALVERRDLWSLRDLRKRHVGWLRALREQVLDAVVKVYRAQGLEKDELKCYVHYQPTYYHFHIHVVHVQLEAGTTQSVGKAFGLENLISQLESMAGDVDTGMDGVDISYFLGEASELWEGVFGLLKRGEEPTI